MAKVLRPPPLNILLSLVVVVVPAGPVVAAVAVVAALVVSVLPLVLLLQQALQLLLLSAVGALQAQVLLALVVPFLCLARLLLQPVAVEQLAPLDFRAVLEVVAAAALVLEQAALVQLGREMMAAKLQREAMPRGAVAEQVVLVEEVLTIMLVLVVVAQPHLMEQHTQAVAVGVVLAVLAAVLAAAATALAALALAMQVLQTLAVVAAAVAVMVRLLAAMGALELSSFVTLTLSQRLLLRQVHQLLQ
jgi:hypothetical protein